MEGEALIWFQDTDKFGQFPTWDAFVQSFLLILVRRTMTQWRLWCGCTNHLPWQNIPLNSRLSQIDWEAFRLRTGLVASFVGARTTSASLCVCSTQPIWLLPLALLSSKKSTLRASGVLSALQTLLSLLRASNRGAIYCCFTKPVFASFLKHLCATT